MGAPGQLVRADTTPFPARALCWLPDGQGVAAGGTGGSDFTEGFLTVFPVQPGPARWSVADRGPIHDVAVSRDSQWLAVAGDRSGVVSAADGAVRFPAFERYVGHAVAFGPDGSLVAWSGTIFEDVLRASVRAADARTGVKQWEDIGDSPGRLAFSPDSGRLAATGSTELRLIDVDSADVVRLPLASDAFDVAYSQDGRWVAAGCHDGTIQIFDVATGQPARTVRVHVGAVLSVAFSPDGRWVAGVAEPGVGVYGVTDGRPRWPELADVPEGSKVVFSPDLRYVAVNQTVGNPSVAGLAVLDTATGAPVWQATTSDRVADLEFSPDGGLLAASGGNADGTGFVRLYDTGVEVARFPAGAAIIAVEASPAGPVLLAVGDAKPEVTVVAAANGARLGHKPVPGTLAGVAFAERGQSVTYGGSSGLRLFSTVGDRSWKLDSIGAVNAVAVGGSAGEWIAAVGGRSARVLSSADGSERWAAAHPQTVTRVAMSQDGRWVATGCTDRRTRILDATNGTEAFGTDADGKVFDVAFSPSGTLLATANEDGTAVIVNTATMAVTARITRNFACATLAFNRDETLLATAWDDNTVSIHDLTAPGPPPELRRLTYPNPVSALSFDPAGPALCVATGTPTAVLLDPLSGLEILRLPHLTPVRHVAFSADGTLIATASDDDIVRVVHLRQDRPG